ncbi:hypothetical protein F4779DRAFT_615102 [Xylariaceae sp. FL0662B]|nr:hypothetical protein F4779DRAFT_615102 [Xylariaceae sp. FL0662B]
MEYSYGYTPNRSNPFSTGSMSGGSGNRRPSPFVSTNTAAEAPTLTPSQNSLGYGRPPSSYGPPQPSQSSVSSAVRPQAFGIGPNANPQSLTISPNPHPRSTSSMEFTNYSQAQHSQSVLSGAQHPQTLGTRPTLDPRFPTIRPPTQPTNASPMDLSSYGRPQRSLGSSPLSREVTAQSGVRDPLPNRPGANPDAAPHRPNHVHGAAGAGATPSANGHRRSAHRSNGRHREEEIVGQTFEETLRALRADSRHNNAGERLLGQTAAAHALAQRHSTYGPFIIGNTYIIQIVPTRPERISLWEIAKWETRNGISAWWTPTGKIVNISGWPLVDMSLVAYAN